MSKTLPTVLASLMLALPLAPCAFAEAVDGPRYANTRVNALSTQRFKPILFAGGRWAVVTVNGDRDTGLDVYVYDSEGTMVACDEGPLDIAIVWWMPSHTAYYTIVVINRGNIYNRFSMRTN